MGFFKRILSIGSKKNKKKRPEIGQPLPVDEVGLHPETPHEDDTEAAVNLLLRSSSTRYAVVAEMDCTSLPPLPHPIDNVLNTPSASTTSLDSTSLSRKGTYNVKLHPREQRDRTDSGPRDTLATPRAPQQDTDNAAESSQFIRLRRDPSVASLLDLYDEHGNLPAQAFSDSPTKEEIGRAQTKRSGSTLRQLLGDPNSEHDSNCEGDISWAERYLGEGSSAASSASSLILQTPDNFDSHLPDNHLVNNHVHNDITFSSDHDLSSSLIENPAISSMEVELSINTENSHIGLSHSGKTPYQHDNDPKTPRRASQIFGFLTERRRSRAPEDCDRSLPDPPSAFSSPSDKDSTEGPLRSRFSTDYSSESMCVPSSLTSIIPATPIPQSVPDTPGHHRNPAISFNFHESRLNKQTRPDSYISVRAPSPLDINPVRETGDIQSGSQSTAVTSQNTGAETNEVELAKARKVKVILTAPTKVIVTAPTPSNNPEHNRPPSRIPRGSRSVKKRPSSNSLKEHRTTLLDRSNSANSNDPFTPIISLPRKLHRTSSSSSVRSGQVSLNEKSSSPRKEKKSSTLREQVLKENNLGLSVKADVPFTPIRSNSSRSFFRTAVTPAAFRPPPGMVPSPASSSELSPVGKQMMMEARRQKSMMRELEKGRDGRRKSTRK
ncbi:hypothetical protein Moror_17236 [Moniliophthora roreri MCA 2997]|uniref:Uncharacterized protein n=2 Tax=Moniliophthora roreri TaxID=221103 RepID=V2XVM3_MONRO|nr:hypothetical protein Moror_17236 [Moniliophthora roreri MCA 2997]